MDGTVYLAMAGVRQTEHAQAINTNNLANASTTGFRADLHLFSPAPVDGSDLQSQISSVEDGVGTDFSSGSIASTGRDLDIAIQDSGFIAIQSDDGSEAYTRAGDLRIGSGGLLTTGAGHPVLGNNGPIAIPGSISLSIGEDGTISVQPLGQGPEALATIDRIKLVNPDTALLSKGTDGLFRLPEGEVASADASVSVTSGALEQSNVNIAKTLVNMIELARQYEMQVNVIKSADENAKAAAQMMTIG
jgi:flagellar basal-body rod protein FlgF